MTNPPIDKTCTTCKQQLLLSEFEIDESTNDKHSNICKTCIEHNKEVYGKCCEAHFQEIMIANTFNQLGILLEQLDVIRHHGWEVPRELLEKMFKISHIAGVRCRYDLCSRDPSLSSQFEE